MLRQVTISILFLWSLASAESVNSFKSLQGNGVYIRFSGQIVHQSTRGKTLLKGPAVIHISRPCGNSLTIESRQEIQIHQQQFLQFDKKEGLVRKPGSFKIIAIGACKLTDQQGEFSVHSPFLLYDQDSQMITSQSPLMKLVKPSEMFKPSNSMAQLSVNTLSGEIQMIGKWYSAQLKR